jgi:asparaginyl-tRNA synthetase
MATHTTIDRLADHVGQEVELRGWLSHKRSSGKLHFLEVRDGSGLAQCVVFKGDVSPELFDSAGHLTQETSLSLTGTVREHGKRKGEYEVGVTALRPLAPPARDPPRARRDRRRGA